ncbi:MAG: ATP-binding cassette domain-containing protein [Bacteroidota bacterium]|jgi:ABC-type multidrug transport system ATPase subunit
MKIDLTGCGKSYNRRWLFRDLTCSFQNTESWALLGPNGSGKSTLSLLLCGQVWPTEGSITWKLQDKAIAPEQLFAHIALASPALELPEEFTFRELLDLQGRIKPFLVTDVADVAKSLCDFDDKILDKPVYAYSSGMKQRVKLVLAALCDTPLLILDEPLTNLDTAGFRTYERIIEQYTQHRLVIVASNREDEYGFCNNRLRITPGAGVEVGSFV